MSGRQGYPSLFYGIPSDVTSLSRDGSLSLSPHELNQWLPAPRPLQAVNCAASPSTTA
ncbi:hypothetical protein [Zymomonas mobilis]|uniref:hypothetical protein n=1 Tax=Zymomonas mobilis TaxID=542 RepID=UPI001C63DE5A|nr:hypothetical protein [Zymomonas mobilis]